MTTTDHAVFEAAARRYALGALDDVQSLEVEERIVTDPDAYDLLLTAGDELMEDYLDGALGAEDRRRFESHFLAIPEHQDRLKVLRALRARPSARPAAMSARARGFATAAVVALATTSGVGLWLASQPVPMVAPTPESASRLASSGPAPPSDMPPRGTAPPSVPTGDAARPSAEFHLRGGLTRSAGTLPRVAVPAGAATIRLHLETPEPLAAGTYQVTIEDADGAEVHTATVQRGSAARSPLTVTVPTDRLPRGDYRLVLSTADAASDAATVATFPFRVTASPTGR